MKTPSINNKSIVVYRRYINFDSHEYVRIFRGRVYSSVSPTCAYSSPDGERLYTVEQLRSIVVRIHNVDVKNEHPHMQTFLFNGVNFAEAMRLLQ